MVKKDCATPDMVDEMLDYAPNDLAGDNLPDDQEDEALVFDFGDRDCSEVDSIRWVANNISRSGVMPEDCPSAVGWTLMLECRTSNAFRNEFLTKMWPKLLPSRAQLDNADNVSVMDGQSTVDLIDRIAKVRDDLKPKDEEEQYSTFEEFSQEDPDE